MEIPEFESPKKFRTSLILPCTRLRAVPPVNASQCKTSPSQYCSSGRHCTTARRASQGDPPAPDNACPVPTLQKIHPANSCASATAELSPASIAPAPGGWLVIFQLPSSTRQPGLGGNCSSGTTVAADVARDWTAWRAGGVPQRVDAHRVHHPVCDFLRQLVF